MKLIAIILFAACIQVSAKGYSQITLSETNTPLQKVFQEIQQQSGYDFVSTYETLKEAGNVTVNVRNVSLPKALEACLKGKPLNYVIIGKTVVVQLKEKDNYNANHNTIALEPLPPPPIEIHGKVVNQKGDPLQNVSILIVGTNVGTTTNIDGRFMLTAPSDKNIVLEISSVGYQSKEVNVGKQTEINITLEQEVTGLSNVVVVGYGTQKKKDITAAISSVTSKDIENVHGGATVSSALAGKVSGLSFRQSEGRPGASAGIQIRNMGKPLYVIDGVVKDEGQFNNISPIDIASISVLKDASAAIYGARAANGVVVVTTKQGTISTPKLKVNTYAGWQNMTHFPNNVVDAYHWQLYAADAQMNNFGKTSITPDEIAKWKDGTDYGYQSFSWADFIFQKNAPQSSLNVNVSGGDKITNYYFSLTRLSQDAMFHQYNFNRTNMQSNIETHIGKRLKVGVNVNGRIEVGVNPGVPGGDDYGQPLLSTMRNLPSEHPYANNNPEFLNDIGHNDQNAGLWSFERSGKRTNTWRVLGTDFHAEYDLPIKGLSVKGLYSYYYANNYLTNHEYTYDAYTYNPNDSTYKRTGGSINPYQERGSAIITNTDIQGQLNYNNTFGKHNLGATFITEWYQQNSVSNRIHDVPPVNQLDLVQLNTIDTYQDQENDEARIGYIGRVTYNYASKYYVELSGREDASWKWPPNHRWGFFPSTSVGWRISKEPFFTSLIGDNSALSDFKIRASYGKLGDDNVAIDQFGYTSGYNYAVGTVILDGQSINSSRDRGVPITNITWFTSNITDIGIDFSFWNGKLSGSIDYFYRKRTGLLATKNDVLIPNELGYTLPPENLNSDAQMGGEFALSYANDLGKFHYKVGGNISFSRAKTLHTYNPKWGNSLDHYRNSVEERWSGIFWGYEVSGRFQSQDEINNYKVNIDGQGNKTLLPGDLIYKDMNGDGVINSYDERPIGYNVSGPPSLYGGLDVPLAYSSRLIKTSGGALPSLYGGLNIEISWKGFDFSSDFSYGSLYSFNRTSYARIPFQSGGNLLKDFTDRWHREDPFDLNSSWVEGKYPPLRFNDPGKSSYSPNSTFWLINVKQVRLRTLEIGYTLPTVWSNKAKIQQVRIYLNAYNLFAFDNVPRFLDPEASSSNGLQYPQSKFVNVGFNLTF